MTREELRDYVDEERTLNNIPYHVYSTLIDGIDTLEQEPKIGHWEYVQYDYNPRLGNWHCSECRCVIVACVDKNEKSGIPLYKYCPNCGARMKSEV